MSIGWDDMDCEAKAALIECMAFTLCNGDDLNISMSNIGRQVFEEYDLDVIMVDAALTAIAKRLRRSRK